MNDEASSTHSTPKNTEPSEELSSRTRSDRCSRGSSQHGHSSDLSNPVKQKGTRKRGQRRRSTRLDEFRGENESSLLDVFQSTHIRSTRLESQNQLSHVLLGHSVVGHREEVDDDQSKLVLVGAGHLVPISQDIEDRGFRLLIEKQ